MIDFEGKTIGLSKYCPDLGNAFRELLKRNYIVAPTVVMRQSHLKEVGISAEVIDPVSLSPMDYDAIIESVRRTGRLLVVDAAWTSCGASAEIAARVSEALQLERRVVTSRMGFEPVVCPTTKNLENLYYPTSQSISSTEYSVVHEGAKTWEPEPGQAPEVIEFKGPF